MTIGALVVRQRLSHFPCGVALRAFDAGVLTRKRVIRLAMVERLADDQLEARGRVACLAIRAEAVRVRVGVTGRAIRIDKVLIDGVGADALFLDQLFSAGHGSQLIGVALGAIYFTVLACQRISCFVV